MALPADLAHPACAEPRLGVFLAGLTPALGGPRARLRVPWACYGMLDRRQTPLVVLGGISADRRIGEWWAAQLAPGAALDPARRPLLGLDYLSDRPPGWPGIAPRDQAARVIALLDRLGIGRSVVVGASYGGAVALALAARYPERLRAALVIGMAHRPHPMASALRGIQRDLVRLGLGVGRGREAVALARALAVTAYRSEREFAARFAGPWRADGEGVLRRPVEGYLRVQGERFAARFSPERFLALSESLDLHEEDPEALRGVPLFLLAVAEDRLVPRADMEELAERSGASLTVLSSPYGHDAFLKEHRAVGGWLEAALASAEILDASRSPKRAHQALRVRP